jgi:hypothetical protein
LDFSILDFGLKRRRIKRMNAFPSQSLFDNRKPVVSRVEPSAIQNPKWAGLFAIIIALTVWVARVEAQQPEKIYRIGFLDPSTPSGMAVMVDAFRQELSKLGWIEGKNIRIEYRFAGSKPDRLPELAADLVRLKVDLKGTTGVKSRVE